MRTHARGFHAQPSTMAAECSKCHPEHGGRAFRLVAWDGGSPETFDHARAGWTLEGAHATTACAECHKAALAKSPALAGTKLTHRGTRVWIGLEPACVSCHLDPHRKQLGTSCCSCHDEKTWSPAPRFDHAQTSYPLTGKHARVECAACHATPAVARTLDAKGMRVPQWKPLAHTDCSACHSDPHASRFGNSCVKCHTTESFHEIAKGAFDHDKTRYPLRGAHATVSCAKCHDAKAGGRAHLTFGACTDCHRDAHNGLATIAGTAQDCSACHDVRAFRPSTYTAARHQSSAFPLDGAHVAAACGACHVTRTTDTALGNARVALRPAHAECSACHADPHAGRFAASGARPQKHGCSACHTTARFRPSRYDEQAHRSCVFPLDGAHRAVPCQECHEELKAVPAATTVIGTPGRTRPLRFDNRARACSDCHADPHQAQFASRSDRGACQACHASDAFVPASLFVHDRDTTFRLEGAHSRTACAQCHATERPAKGAPFVRYRPLSGTCEACHA